MSIISNFTAKSINSPEKLIDTQTVWMDVFIYV